MTLSLFFDGSCEPVNPGGLGSWGYILSADGKSLSQHHGVIPKAPTTTNNLAEWTALVMGLRELDAFPNLRAGVKALLIRGDSKLVVSQLAGSWACRAANLQPLLAEARELLGRIGLEWKADWIPRADNAEADALTQRAWEQETGRPFPERVRRGA